MADGNITLYVTTQTAQEELARMLAENAALKREAHEWWTALANATKQIELLTQENLKLRKSADRYEGLRATITNDSDRAAFDYAADACVVRPAVGVA